MNHPREESADPRQIELRILEATQRAGKTYEFNEVHDASVPIDWWFQESDEGLVLFVVFYTRACQWSLCTGCNLPSVSSRRNVGYRDLIRQIDQVFDEPDVIAREADIEKVILSNNGSVLDEATFPSTALMHLMVRLNLRFPRLRVISMETRCEYVDIDELKFLARAMKEREAPADIELAIGFEAFDDHIRNQVFRKGLTLRGFEDLVRKVEGPHFRLKCYFMQKPVVGMTDAEAVADIQAGIDYLAGIARRHELFINMHLNPTFVARGTPLESAFAAGAYEPPRLADVVDAVLWAEGKRLPIFVGLYDEGLAVPGGTCLRPEDTNLEAAITSFNRTQDFAALAASRRSA